MDWSGMCWKVQKSMRDVHDLRSVLITWGLSLAFLFPCGRREYRSSRHHPPEDGERAVTASMLSLCTFHTHKTVRNLRGHIEEDRGCCWSMAGRTLRIQLKPLHWESQQAWCSPLLNMYISNAVGFFAFFCFLFFFGPFNSAILRTEHNLDHKPMK